jgi:hypothetical protein
MSNRRRPFPHLAAAAFTAFFGVIAFSGVASNPRFETIHVLDAIRLMTAGAAIAVTLMMLIEFFNRGPLSEDKKAGEKSGEESN